MTRRRLIYMICGALTMLGMHTTALRAMPITSAYDLTSSGASSAIVQIIDEEMFEGDAKVLAFTPHIFRGRTQVVTEGPGNHISGEQRFENSSSFEIRHGGRIVGGSQLFRDDSTLMLKARGTIAGGKQLFVDRSKLRADAAITGGEQLFKNYGSIVTDQRDIISGGHQQFEDHATFETGHFRAITGGKQTFRDHSSLNALAKSVSEAKQFFYDYSTLNANGKAAISGRTAEFNDQSSLRLNAENGISPGASIALNNSATFHMLGHSASLDTAESLDFHSRALIRNGAASNVTLAISPSTERQPFFNGRIMDGGTGSLSLIKDGPRAFHLGGNDALMYSGSTEVRDGVLALRRISVDGIPNGKEITLNGGWLDMSELAPEAQEKIVINGTDTARVIRHTDVDKRNISRSLRYEDELGSPTPSGQKSFLLKTGPGKLTLKAANHYVGATRIEEGTLSISQDAQLGNPGTVRSVLLVGGTLEISKDLRTERSFELRGHGAVDVMDTTSSWRSVLQDDQPGTVIKRGMGQLELREESRLSSVIVEAGSIHFSEAPKIEAAERAIAVEMKADGGSASFNNGYIRANQADAIAATANQTATPSTNSVVLTKMKVASRIGAALSATAAATMHVTAEETSLAGDLRADGGAHLDLTLAKNSSLTGGARMGDSSRIAINVADASSVWNISRDATVSSLSNKGSIQFGAGKAAARWEATIPAEPVSPHATLRVKGNYDGGGRIGMRVHLAKNGTVQADRLLIEGDAVGETELDVVIRKDGSPKRTSSVSLVQVGGHATATSFTLAGGEITLPGSAFKHVLHAYGPDALPHKPRNVRNAALDGNLNWDYRLQVAHETTLGELVDFDEKENLQETDELSGNLTDKSDEPIVGPQPPPKPRIKPPQVRPKLYAQASAYLSSARALQNYRQEITTALHNQLHENRQHSIASPESDHTSFARIIGGAQNYRSTADWRSHGTDFDQKIVALQFGSSLLRHHTPDHTFTLSGAATLGDTQLVTLGLPSNRSSASFQTRDVALAGGVSTPGGAYVDVVASAGNADAKVRTPAHRSTAEFSGKSVGLSIEAGKTFRLKNGLEVQPQVQLQYQRLMFERFNDRNLVKVVIGPSHSLTARAGARVAWPQNDGAWTPYLHAHVLHGWSGTPSVRIADSSFITGGTGSAVELAAGVSARLGRSTSLSGAFTQRVRLGGSGASGKAGTVGLQYRF